MTQAAKFFERLVACALVLGALVLGGLAGGASAAAQDALRLPTSAGDEPLMVSSISFRSYPEVNGTYERGETVEVAVDFTARVNVTGSPQLALIVGDQTRWATHSHNIIWTNKLSFRYTVQAADQDTNGIGIPADGIRLNGGSIRASPEGVIDAVLTNVGLGDSATHSGADSPGWLMRERMTPLCSGSSISATGRSWSRCWMAVRPTAISGSSARRRRTSRQTTPQPA